MGRTGHDQTFNNPNLRPLNRSTYQNRQTPKHPNLQPPDYPNLQTPQTSKRPNTQTSKHSNAYRMFSRMARVTASVRLAAPSFLRMTFMCALTMSFEMPYIVPISALESPRAAD